MNDSVTPTAGGVARPLIAAAAITLPAAILLYTFTGNTLGLFFGGMILVTLLLPPLVLQRQAWIHQGWIASAVNDSVGVVWLAAVFTPYVTFVQWLLCYLLLASYSFALWALGRALRALRCDLAPASAITILMGLLWLSWPIWLARLGQDRVLLAALPAHPLLALNGVLRNLGIWSEQPIAYSHLLSLGQDLPYQLPPTILASLFAHIIAGGVLFGIATALTPPSRSAEAL